MWVANDMRRDTEAILVGEPTGGKPNAPGDALAFSLARSGLEVFYSTKLWRITEGDPPWIAPDITVQLSSTDFFSGRDPCCKRAWRTENNREALRVPAFRQYATQPDARCSEMYDASGNRLNLPTERHMLR
jgi:hypothetical protein